jgi:hypothetical protein
MAPKNFYLAPEFFKFRFMVFLARICKRKYADSWIIISFVYPWIEAYFTISFINLISKVLASVAVTS